MRYSTLKRLVKFYYEPGMTVGEFLEIIKGLNNANK
nr:MAG TPA: hypothetical protein [Inoviridae sp.]